MRSAPFRDFCGADRTDVLKDSLTGLRSGFIDRAIPAGSLWQPLAELVRREPVACSVDTPLSIALERMSKAGVGTIAIIDQDRRPRGIFTLTDLMNRVVLPGLPLGTAVGAVMTSTPARLDENANAQDAMALMATQGLRQLLITRDGILSGVVSERDLFSLQRASIRGVLQSVRTAADMAGLAVSRGEIARLTDNLLAQGILPEHLTLIVTALNDAVVQRVIDLRAASNDLAPIRYAWLALGSEGRREQTVVTDQDNALIFETASGDTEQARGRLLPFAASVNAALAALGFPLCPGNIMAGNADCCLSGAEWRERFAGWIREPTPGALLNANIFFDFRPIAGAPDLAEDLRSWVLARTPESRLFLRLLVANALQCEPPLGLMRSFRTDEGEHAGTIDLKTHGTRLFVDAARVLALAFGVQATHTAERMREGMRRLHLPERELAGIVQGFEFVQLLRLRLQRHDANRVDPYALSDPDQRSLKEALRQARQLQLLIQRFVAV